MKIEWIADEALPSGIMALMESVSGRCLEAEGVTIPCSVTVRLCGDEEIEALNSSFRGIARSTDVLSFPTVSYPPGKTAGSCENLLRREFDDESGTCFLGDIVISVPHVYAQAEEYGHSVEREAAYLLVHGICHLMGYDHMEEEEKARMRAMEEKILAGGNRENPLCRTDDHSKEFHL